MSKKHKTRQKSPRVEDANPSKRVIAYAIDWAIGGVASGFPAVMLYGLVTRRSDMFSDLYVFEALGHGAVWGPLAGLLCLLAATAYFVAVPLWVWPGQTLGKRLMRLRVVGDDGLAPGLRALLVRQVVVGFLLEGSGFVVSRYLRQTLTLLTRFDVETVWTWIGLALTVVSAFLALYRPAHKALHDYAAGTRVVVCPEPNE